MVRPGAGLAQRTGILNHSVTREGVVRLRTPVVAGCVAGFLALAAACSDDGGGSADTTDEATDAPSDGVPIEEWTASVCSSMLDWVDAIAVIDQDAQDVVGLRSRIGTGDRTGDTGLDTGDTGNTGSNDLDPAEARELLVDLFDDAAAASDAFVEELEDAGVPEGDDGEELADLFVESFTVVADAFAAARDDSEGLPVGSRAEFEEDAQLILDDIDVASTNIETAFNEADSELEVDEFEDAYGDNETCQELDDTEF
jgi:hypothetical protein